MKQLYLVRHAKSSWDDSSLSDSERPLNKRGLKNAPDMGRRLKMAGTPPQLIISSPAKRALTTAQFMAQAIDYDTQSIVQDDRLYFEGVSSMQKLISTTEAALETIMLVGHNPDMTSLFNKLCGFQTPNMPTCAIACIQFEQSWPDINSQKGILLSYDYPKNLNYTGS